MGGDYSLGPSLKVYFWPIVGWLLVGLVLFLNWDGWRFLGRDGDGTRR